MLKKHRQLIIGICIGALLFGIIPTFAENLLSNLQIKNNPFPIFVNGNQEKVNAYNIDGYTYLKLADVGKLLNATVKFNETESKIEITKKEDGNMSDKLSEPFGEYKAKEMREESLRKRTEVSTDVPQIYEKNGIKITKIDNVEYVFWTEIHALLNKHGFLNSEFDREKFYEIVPNIEYKNSTYYLYSFIEQHILPYIEQSSFEIDGYVFKKNKK